MTNQNIKKLVTAALLAAMTCVATMIIKIPTPTFGYIHPGDGFVLLCGVVLGSLPGAAHPGRFRRYPPGTPGPGTHCPDGRLFPAQPHHLCRCLSLHRPHGSGSLCPNSARLSAYRRRLGMADALFRKDIRRQKRELTAMQSPQAQE